MLKSLARWFAWPAAVVATAAFAPPPATEAERPHPSWLMNLGDDDRACLERNIGFAPPPLGEGLLWFNSDPRTWADLRRKVVVIQSWTSRTTSGRNWVGQASRTVGENEDVVLIALHTPEGAQNAGAFLDRRPIDVPVIVDVAGDLCDALGVFERPVNIVIDRSGAVRFVGLNQRGLKNAVADLLAEPYDPDAEPPAPPRDAEVAAPEFPPTTGRVTHATDVRGRRPPAMRFTQWKWLTGRPDLEGKAVLIDFWATWCGPCVRGIPHLNEIADEFREELAVIGVSDENEAAFNRGLQRHGLDESSFRYALALDPGGRMSKAMRVLGLPHTIVMSSDGVVRWQGNPYFLRLETVRQIVEASATAGAGPQQACHRWAAR